MDVIISIVVTFQCSDKLGLSLELGSFAAGVMISTTDLAQHTLEQVRFLGLCICFCSHTIPDDFHFDLLMIAFCFMFTAQSFEFCGRTWMVSIRVSAN